MITIEQLDKLSIFQLEALKRQADSLIARKKRMEFKQGAKVKINDVAGTWFVDKLEPDKFIARKMLLNGKLGLPYRYNYDDVVQIHYESDF